VHTLRKKRRNLGGFSLIEALVSTFIFLAFMAAVFSAVNSSRGFAGVQDTLAKMQMDSRKVLERIGTELRMAGWLDGPAVGDPPLPYVFFDGNAEAPYSICGHEPAAQHVPATSPAFGDVRELVFRRPVDQDGDGLLTNGTTGEVEWSPYYIAYALITDAGGVNTLVRTEDGVITDIMARYVERITFNTIYTDGSIAMNDIVITIYMAKPTPRGEWLQTSMSTCITMRNVDDAS